MPFYERHFGDIIALYFIHLGIALLVFDHNNATMIGIGSGLFSTGLGTLRFRGVLNGGGNKSAMAPNSDASSPAVDPTRQ